MNTNPPTGGEEEAASASLEKLPKLNLPPKPVLAATAPPTPLPVATPLPTAKLTSEPPPIVAIPTVPPPTPAPVATPAKKSEPTQISGANKKRATLSMPLAIIAFIVALLGLIVQLIAFLHLF